MDLGELGWVDVGKIERQRNIKDWSHVTSLLFGTLARLPPPWCLIKLISSFYAGWPILFIMHMCVYRDLRAPTGVRPWVGVSMYPWRERRCAGEHARQGPKIHIFFSSPLSRGPLPYSAGKGNSMQPLLMPGNSLLALLQVGPGNAAALLSQAAGVVSSPNTVFFSGLLWLAHKLLSLLYTTDMFHKIIIIIVKRDVYATNDCLSILPSQVHSDFKKKYAMTTVLIILCNLDWSNSTGEKKSHERVNHLLFTGKGKCVRCSRANPSLGSWRTSTSFNLSTITH